MQTRFKQLLALGAFTLLLQACGGSNNEESATSATNEVETATESSAMSDSSAAGSMSWDEWASWIESVKPVADKEGHGPDVGSDEWASALAAQAGINKNGHGPDMKSAEWRSAIEKKLGVAKAE